VTLEVARRLALRGDKVEWFAASYPGAPDEEVIDGVRIVRSGRQWSVHWRACRRYRSNATQNFDVVVDQVNTMPFFAPRWAHVPVVMFIHQLAREVWWYESKFPISAVGYVAEPRYLRTYKAVPVITVSDSTKADLVRLGLNGPITVIPEGLEAVGSARAVPADTPSFVYVGRLNRSKRVDDIIRAFGIFGQTVEGGSLTLIGDGPPPYVDELKRLAKRLGVNDQVRFVGRVSTELKHLELARAHAILLASVREGWGLVVTEANAMGVPAIGYDVPGLRDSIRHDSTGLLVDASPASMAKGMLDMWVSPVLHDRLSAAALEWARSFSFDNTAQAFRAALEAAIGSQAAPGKGLREVKMDIPNSPAVSHQTGPQPRDD